MPTCKHCQTTFKSDNPKAEFCKPAHRVAFFRASAKPEDDEKNPLGPSVSAPAKPCAAKPPGKPSKPSPARDLSTESPWIGPRIWVDMTNSELHKRLTEAGAYRDWAIRTGLNHMALTRGEVINLIKQAGHEPAENLIALTIREAPSETEKIVSKPAPARPRIVEEEDEDPNPVMKDEDDDFPDA